MTCVRRGQKIFYLHIKSIKAFYLPGQEHCVSANRDLWGQQAKESRVVITDYISFIAGFNRPFILTLAINTALKFDFTPIPLFMISPEQVMRTLTISQYFFLQLALCHYIT